MTNVKRVQFQTTIKAPVEVVWDTMLSPEGYRKWTKVFAEGSYYEGSWSKGSRIKFLAPTGDGMIAEIAELKPQEFISIRHLGTVANGVEDTESAEVRAWAPAYENYTFSRVPEGTKLVIDQDATEDSEEIMKDLWTKAFEALKQLCEESGTA